MSRLIDADKLRLSYWIPGGTSTVSIAGHCYFYSRTEVDDAPTVDAEPIVRCKDCKYFKFGNGCFLQSVDYDWEEQMYVNDFCSRGERRDEQD